MQDPCLYSQRLNCPRCNSSNTKFCYFNNYNFSQPRHFCKSCRRYWTRGGALRNIPVGGGTRKKAKRSEKRGEIDGAVSDGNRVSDGRCGRAGVVVGGTEIARAASPVDVAVMGDNFTGHFDGLGPSGLTEIDYGHNSDSDPNPGHSLLLDIGNSDADGLFPEFHNSDCWGGCGAATPWPDLAVYTPGSTTFH